MNRQPHFETLETDSIDFNRLLGKLWAGRMLLLACLATGLFFAWLVNIYTTPSYMVTSSIIAKGEKEGVITELLQDENDQQDISSLFSSRDRNIADEIAVIRSKPLLEKILYRPEFSIGYYLKGSVRDEELYKDAPFMVTPVRCGQEPPDDFFIICNSDGKGFRMGTEKTVRYARHYAWGDTVQLSDTCSCAITQRHGIRLPDNSDNDLYFFRLHTLSSLVNSYAGNLQVPEPKNSYVIEISLNTTHPEKGIDFLNQLMAAYIAEKMERKNQSALKTIEFIDGQLGDITKSLLKVENRLENFKRGNKLASGYMNTNTFFDKAAELEREKTKLLLMENYIDYIDKYMQESEEYDKIITPSAANVDDKVLSGLVSELVQLQLEKNTYLRNAKEKNPFLNEVNTRISNVKQSLHEAVTGVRATNALALRNIEAQIQSAEASAGVLPEKEREFVGINRLYTVNENVYVMLLQKRLEADLMRAAATVDSRVVESAYLSKQLGPKKVRNYLLGLLTGLFIPGGLIVLAELFRSGVETVEELKRLSKIPLLGAVAHIENPTGKSSILLEKPKSALAESFRALRSNLNFAWGANEREGAKVILITSSIAGEGKSFCSINLALVLALSGQKVVHITADMRRPGLFTDLLADPASAEQGLSTYLSQLAEPEQVIVPSIVPGLDLMPAGPVPPNPSELLLNKHMSVLMNELKQRYDYVVLDTPPIGLVSDSSNLMRHSDVNLYIVKYRYTPAEKIRDINTMYLDGQISNLFLVFNDVKLNGKSYGYYEE